MTKQELLESIKVNEEYELDYSTIYDKVAELDPSIKGYTYPSGNGKSGWKIKFPYATGVYKGFSGRTIDIRKFFNKEEQRAIKKYLEGIFVQY